MSCRVVKCCNVCECCRDSLKVPSTAIALTAGVLTITTASIEADDLTVCQPICILLEQPLPAGIFNATVSVVFGTSPAIPVVTRCGGGGRYAVDTDEVFNILKVRYFDRDPRLLLRGLSLRSCC